jgi:NADH:ubiquinone oxidoreductase subunit 6 (subunit J)
MAVLLITGLIIDLLGPWLGGWLLALRSIAHGYLGAVFVLVFAVYIGSVLGSKKMRTVLTVTNYVDFVFYIILIITGITIASPNKPWVDLFPGLSNALSSITWIAPAIHVATTYIWILFSTVAPGGILHGLASVYLISHLKKKRRVIESQRGKEI